MCGDMLFKWKQYNDGGKRIFIARQYKTKLIYILTNKKRNVTKIV